MFEKNKICFVVSALMTVRAFLDNHIKELFKFYDIYIVANITEKDKDYLQTLPIKGYKSISLERNIHLLKDIKAVNDLTRYFKREKFFAIHSVTPKAGLITSIAGRLSKTGNRIHIFTGQVWTSKKGIMKELLKSLDKLIAWQNTHILVDGRSQREFLIKNNVCRSSKSFVLANGSIAGVDTERFCPNENYRTYIRRLIGIKENQIVFIFLGRLCKDKGIDELLDAFSKLQKEYNNVFLLLVGADEDNYATRINGNYSNLEGGKNYCLYGLTNDPEQLLNAGDVFCLPSYREGFGVSVIEASSVGLPVIVSDTYGLRDSILPEVTGLVCKTYDVDSLHSSMKVLIEQADFRNLLGKNGRDYVLKWYKQSVVSKAWVEFYSTLGKSELL
ncbi:MAG: glycosyltransferase family 4 protein [Mangrovibacterium sp.]